MPLCSATREQRADQRVDETQLVKRLRPKLARDASDVLEALLDYLGQLGELATLGVLLLCSVLSAKRDRCQRLAELVVQLTGDPEALLLLRGEDPPGALAPLVLEPFEHLVERPCQRQHLAARAFESDRALTGAQEIDRAHHPG